MRQINGNPFAAPVSHRKGRITSDFTSLDKPDEGMEMTYQHQKESDLQKQIIELLEFQGFLVMRINQGMDRRGGRAVFYAYWTTKDHETMTEGIADVIAFRAPSGRVLALEVKQPGEKARIAQKEFLQRVNLGGGIGRVVDSIDSAQSAINEYLLKE